MKKLGLKSHGLLMIICCLAPIIILATLLSSSIVPPGLKNVLYVLLIIACPLGHVLMMKFMPHTNQHEKNGVKEENKSCH